MHSVSLGSELKNKNKSELFTTNYSKSFKFDSLSFLNRNKSRRSISNFRELVKTYSYKRIIPEKREYSAADNIKGSLIMTFSAFICALLLLIQKIFFKDYPQISFAQQNIMKGIFMGGINAILILKEKELFYFDKSTNIILFKRIFCGFFAELLMFLSTDYLRINTTSVFYILYAVICSLVSGIVLGELVTKKDIFIIVSCFLSACLIIKPFFGKGEDSLLGVCMGLTSAIGFCMMVIYHKFLDGKCSNYTINFYFGLCYLLQGLITQPLSSQSFIWSAGPMFFLCILGILYFIGGFIYVYAINCGKLSYILPFENTNVVFSILFGYYILGESCDYLDIIGTNLILGFCVYRSLILIKEDSQDEEEV